MLAGEVRVENGLQSAHESTDQLLVFLPIATVMHRVATALDSKSRLYSLRLWLCCELGRLKK